MKKRKKAAKTGVRVVPNTPGIDSLITKAFNELDAHFDALVARGRAALQDYENAAGTTQYNENRVARALAAEEMAVVLRGLIRALGRSD